MQLLNQSKLQAPSADRAALFLDSALAARNGDKRHNSHLLFTLYIQQHHLDQANIAGSKAAPPTVCRLMCLGQEGSK